MRQGFRYIAAGAAALALGLGWTGSIGTALSQTSAVNQIKLTEQTVKNFIALQKDEATSKLREAADPKAKFEAANFEATAKKYGFVNPNDLDVVAANIFMVMNRLDPQSGQYTDPADFIKKGMSEIVKDRSIAEKDKNQIINDMADTLRATPPLKYKENIELVSKHYKDIKAALGIQ
jgi:hypothetical protein